MTISNIFAFKENNQLHLALLKVNELLKQDANIRIYQIKG
jgi:hypothetical protein